MMRDEHTNAAAASEPTVEAITTGPVPENSSLGGLIRHIDWSTSLRLMAARGVIFDLI